MTGKLTLCALLCASLCACSGYKPGYRIPVDSQLQKFEAPDPDDLVEGDDEEEEEEDYGDEGEEGEEGDEDQPPADDKAKKAPTSSVGGSAPVVTGTLKKEQIRAAVRKQLRPITSCYEKALLREPKLAGRIVTNFSIGPSGKVTQAAVSSTDFKKKDVPSCVVKQVKAIAFPKPPGGGTVRVKYPFVFRPA